MRASLVVLVFLQLCVHAQLAPTHDACAEVKEIPHAHLTNETTRDEYRPGDEIHYRCETGYISGPTIRFNCTTEGWVAIYSGSCYLKPCPLPEDTLNGQYMLIDGDDFVFGTTVQYVCNEGYQMMSYRDTRLCTLGGWSNHVPICEPLRCERPVADGITIRGLPDSGENILPDRFLTFSCNAPLKVLSGRSTVICGRDGRWDHPFPTCEDIRCEVEAMHPSLTADGLTPADKSAAIGHKLRFRCGGGRSLAGPIEIQCLDTGRWSAPFPTCHERCRVTALPPNVNVPDQRRTFEPGEKLTFSCRLRHHVIQGRSEVTCLADGRWSDSLPTCGPPEDCGQPPFLPNGDTKASLKFRYKHNEKVEHTCQQYYVMQGGPFKTCSNGQWVGDMTCLKPCTVDRTLMNQHNIRFRYSRDDKMYSEHDDTIEFLCISGRSVGGVATRQKCINGAIALPTCR